MRELKVYINAEIVGVLFEDNDIWSFQYTQGGLEI